jgi:UDP-N-acetylmuramate dehydrogenase
VIRPARDRVDEAAGLLGSLVERDVPLGPLTTYRVGGAAALFARPSSFDELQRIAEVTGRTGLPVIVIGRGSNMLVADGGLAGVAISLSAMAADIEIDDVVVSAGGAVPLPVLARRTVAASLSGFEWAVGVPGTVGGGVRMNAGGHGSDMAAALVDVEIFDLRRVERATVAADRLGLRFRASNLADHQVVLSARVRLMSGSREAGEAELDEVVRWRREHQPGGQNAGSVFVNPVPGEVTAGALIDRLGLRGMRIGTAHVSEKHANFIQADEGGLASDVRSVIEAVRSCVAEQTGYVLRSEVRLVGFADVVPDETPGVIW